MATKNEILSMVKVGDTVEITPIEKLPNLDRKFKVNKFIEEEWVDED